MPETLSIITGIFPPDAGGPAKFAREFGDWLAKENLDIRIITYANQDSRQFLSSNLLIASVARSHPLPVRIFKFVTELGPPVKDELSRIAVGAFVEVYLASILFKFPYVVKVPGDIVWERARNNKITQVNIEEFQKMKLSLKYRIFRTLFTRSLKRARLVIVPSLGLYKLCLNWGVPESQIKLIYNSVDTIADTKDLSKPQKFHLVTVCRLVSWKGVDELIDYAAKRKLSLLVVGDGPDRGRLESLALSLNANVTFTGDVTHQRVFEHLSESGIFVLNSYYEGLPHALVEARVLGVLSIARAGTGSEEVINDDEDGFLIRPDRPLDVTIDMALRKQPNSQLLIERAKTDSLNRFSKARNYPVILKLIESVNR